MTVSSLTGPNGSAVRGSVLASVPSLLQISWPVFPSSATKKTIEPTATRSWMLLPRMPGRMFLTGALGALPPSVTQSSHPVPVSRVP